MIQTMSQQSYITEKYKKTRVYAEKKTNKPASKPSGKREEHQYQILLVRWCGIVTRPSAS